MNYYLLSTKKKSKCFNNLPELLHYLDENDIKYPENIENGAIIGGYFLLITNWYDKYQLMGVDLKLKISEYITFRYNNWDLLIGLKDQRIIQIFRVIPYDHGKYTLREITMTGEDGRALKRVRINGQKFSLGKLYKLITLNKEEQA